MNRNRFLLGAVSGLTIAANFDGFFAKALAAPALPNLPGGADDRVLLVINLQGGNDGLNTVVPHGMPEYYSYRPSLGVAPNDVLRIDERVGLNPALAALKAMYDTGQVAIVQGAGYPNPDHSHFRSTEIWQTAVPDKYATTGWLGRYLDAANLPSSNLFNAVAVSPVLPEALIAERVDVPAIDALRGYGLASDRNKTQRGAFAAFASDTRAPFSSPYLPMVAMIEDHAERGASELPKLVAGYTTNATYPATPLGRSLALAAQIIGSRLGTRVLYVQHGSFDTHVSQKATQDRLLKELSEAVAAFYADLAAHGNEKRTLTMTFSDSAGGSPRTPIAAPITAKRLRCSWSAAACAGVSTASIRRLPTSTTATLPTPSTSAASTRPSSRSGSAARRPASSPAPSRRCRCWGRVTVTLRPML